MQQRITLLQRRHILHMPQFTWNHIHKPQKHSPVVYEARGNLDLLHLYWNRKYVKIGIPVIGWNRFFRQKYPNFVHWLLTNQ